MQVSLYALDHSSSLSACAVCAAARRRGERRAAATGHVPGYRGRLPGVGFLCVHMYSTTGTQSYCTAVVSYGRGVYPMNLADP